MRLHENLQEKAAGQRAAAELARSRENAPGTRHYECLQAITQREKAEGNAAACERIMAEVPDRDFDAWGELHLNLCLKALFEKRSDSRQHRILLAELIMALRSTMPIAA